MLYSEEVLYALLCKYVLSEADAEERLQVEEWLKTDPAHPALLASLKKILLAIPRSDSHTDTAKAWQCLSAKIPEPRRLYGWWMTAATLLLSFGLWLTFRGKTERKSSV